MYCIIFRKQKGFDKYFLKIFFSEQKVMREDEERENDERE